MDSPNQESRHGFLIKSIHLLYRHAKGDKYGEVGDRGDDGRSDGPCLVGQGILDIPLIFWSRWREGGVWGFGGKIQAG